MNYKTRNRSSIPRPRLMKGAVTRFLKSAGIAAFILAALPTLSARADENVKIATVDMQKALQTVDSGKKAKAQLEREFNAKKKDLQTEEAAIRKATEEFKKQSLVMSDEARAKKQGELQERIVSFQERTARSQMEIQQKEKDLTQPIIGRLRSVISDIAKKHGYSVVLEKNENTVLYSLDKDDLTNEVIAGYDKQAKAAKDSG